MTQKLGWTLGGSITLWLLAFFGFQANVEQSPETINGLKIMISFIPALAALISGVFIYFYQLSDAKMKEIEVALAERRA
jgi:GPH family glycoside/pentoside/hexuronide:cation symporter